MTTEQQRIEQALYLTGVNLKYKGAGFPDEALETIRQVLEEKLNGGWQPIETAPIKQHVLVYTKNQSHACNAFVNNFKGYEMVEATHWMPLPTPPEEETK